MSQEELLALEPLRRAVVTASALRLRESPSLESLALSTVPRGTHVDVVGVDPTRAWSQVRYARRVGWMASKYLVAEDHPLAPTSVREEFAWMPIAIGELGVREVPGQGSNPRIIEYLKSTTLDRALAARDSTPWCSGYVNWCVEKAGLAGTDSAAARSWLHWGRPITMPRRGCIAVLSRGDGGHVGCYVRKEPGKVFLLGGNQTNEVCVAGFADGRVLGYRVPP